ncbi:unnamed protein product [Sphenostylis stenocarpa]|uniref:Uncharacterized protein n=1 Tax=Sphenostylis stenocarpa TaxID=92480 RepID=A0AA86W355_9FABA|nr:unnamed protein product [Sphenostylis stenocarpa]
MVAMCVKVHASFKRLHAMQVTGLNCTQIVRHPKNCSKERLRKTRRAHNFPCILINISNFGDYTKTIAHAFLLRRVFIILAQQKPSSLVVHTNETGKEKERELEAPLLRCVRASQKQHPQEQRTGKGINSIIEGQIE